MKNSFKKISISIIAGTIILGNVTSVGAESFNFKNTYSYKYKTTTVKKNNNSVVTETPAKKPNTTTNNDTTITQNNQDKIEPQQTTAVSGSSVESEVLRLVNIERSKAGLSALKMNNSLSDVARMKSQDMADKNYFSHTSPTYGSPFDMMKKFGITYTTAGENIAKGYAGAEAVMNGWMNSPGHKANILNPKFGTLGVGYVNKGGTTYWTQMFTN